MATRRSSSNRSSKSSSSSSSSKSSKSSKSVKSVKSVMSPSIPNKPYNGFIWINNRNVLTKSDPHELGHGATKTVYLSEYSDFGFDIDKIQCTRFNYNNYAIARIEPKDQRKTFSDGEMTDIHDELKLQMEFASAGKAIKILGLLLKFPDNSSVAAYTEADILDQLRMTPNPRVCYILMERCVIKSKSDLSSGKTKSIWDINKDPLKVVQQVIDCISHIVHNKNMVFYDFKEPNLCVSPKKEILTLDFDRYFCRDIAEISPTYNLNDKQIIAQGYMFLLFSCFYYKFGNKNPKIISALYEGIKLFKADQYLEHICRFSDKGRSTLEHYLIHTGDTTAPSFVQYIRKKYLEPMEQIAIAKGTTKTSRGGNKRRTKKRRHGTQSHR